jgi:hypothetical protein
VKERQASGYSGTALPKKLGIREGARVAVVSAPDGFTRRAELARRFPSFVRALESDGGLWVAWPKKTSGVATDLAFDAVRDVGLGAGLVDNKVCAIDATWSALRFVHRAADRPGRR